MTVTSSPTSTPEPPPNGRDYFPIINPDVPIGEDAPTNGYFMAARARNPEGGLAFLAYLGSREVQQKAFDELGRLPTRTDVDVSQASPATLKGIEALLNFRLNS